MESNIVHMDRESAITLKKLPSQNIEAEEALLASLLLYGQKALEKVDNTLQPGDMYGIKHNLIFKAIQSLVGKDQKIEAVSVANELKESGALKKVGGVKYLSHLLDCAQLSPNPEGYARIIKECALKRQLSLIGNKMVSLSVNGKSITDILDFSKCELEKIQQPKQIISIISAADVIKRNPQQTPLIKGFLNKGEGLIIHAAGGVGKSMFSMFLAAQVAERRNDIQSTLLLDEFEIKKQMASLFIQSENSASAINTRLSQMVGSDAKQELDSIFFPEIHSDVLTTGKSFEDPAFIQHCINMIGTIEDKTNQVLDLFIIDPLISFHNGDENDAGRMRAALDGITEIAQRSNATPIVLHHNNRNDDYRGSSAVYDWARNMIALKRVFIGQDRITDYQNGHVVKRTAKVPAIEVIHEKANNLPLFDKFTIVMDHRFRFYRMDDALPPDVQEKCLEVQQALKDMGGFSESNSRLAQAVSELTGRSKRTCSTDIALAAEHNFIQRDLAKKGARGAYTYFLNE